MITVKDIKEKFIFNDMVVSVKNPNISGDYLTKIGIKNTENPESKKGITFAENKTYLQKALDDENISIIITSIGTYLSIKNIDSYNKGFVFYESPKILFYTLNNYFYYTYIKKDFNTHCGENAFIEPTAFISDKNVTIGNNCYIGNNVVILENVTIGDNVVILAGSVIGEEGFEIFNGGDDLIRIKHCGSVIIEDNVEIQSLCHVPKSLLPAHPTKIGKGTKLDSGVHFQHGTQCGKNCQIASCAMIAGNVIIGDNVWIAPQTAVSNNIKIGSNAKVLIGSVVTKDVSEGETISGNFAINHSKHIEFIKKIR